MRFPVLAAVTLAVLSFCMMNVRPAVAAEVKAGAIVVDDAWARASAGPAANGAAYVTLRSQGAADRLVAATSDAAARVELHTHIKEGDVMRMRPVDAIDIGAGQTVALMPGSLHIMLLGLKAPLKEGATLPLTLVLEKAGQVQVQARILAPGAMGPAAHDTSGHGGMGAMGGHK